MAGVPPKKNEAFTLYVTVVSQADTDIFQVWPTIALGDFQVSIDGGGFSSLDTLPVVVGLSKVIKLALSAAEMNGDVITIIGSDLAGDEWCDVFVELFTDTAQVGEISTAIGALNDPSAAVIADGVWDELRAGHAIAGSFGATSEWTNVPLGPGTTPLEVTVTDGVNPLDGAEVDVTLTAVHTAPVASGYTDAFGKVTFHLDPGTYYIWVQHSGYNGTNPTAKVVA